MNKSLKKDSSLWEKIKKVEKSTEDRVIEMEKIKKEREKEKEVGKTV